MQSEPGTREYALELSVNHTAWSIMVAVSDYIFAREVDSARAIGGALGRLLRLCDEGADSRDIRRLLISVGLKK